MLVFLANTAEEMRVELLIYLKKQQIFNRQAGQMDKCEAIGDLIKAVYAAEIMKPDDELGEK